MMVYYKMLQDRDQSPGRFPPEAQPGGAEAATEPEATAKPKAPSKAKPATKVDVSDLPSDWRSFARNSDTHKAMAKAWLAATGEAPITEVAALGSDSSYKAFQRWYADTAEDLGRQFGPAEALKMINKASETPKTTTKPRGISPEQKKQLDRAEENTRFYSKRVFDGKAAIKTMTSQLARMRDELPRGSSFEDNSRLSKVKGLGPKKKAYNEYVDDIMDVITGLRKDQKSLEVARAAKQRFGALEESIKARWQKIIKG